MRNGKHRKFQIDIPANNEMEAKDDFRMSVEDADGEFEITDVEVKS